MDRLLTKKEVAAYLRCSESNINKLMASGKLPFMKVGKLVRFRETDLDRLLGAQNVGTKQNVGTPGVPERIHTFNTNTENKGLTRWGMDGNGTKTN
jgi:excisionase family DNA binding protein